MPITLVDLYRTPVCSAKGKQIGKVADVLFDEKRAAVVGFVVQRPRFLFLLDRRDRFLALDRTAASRAEVRVTSDRAAWDKSAAKRLGLDWDRTVVWSGMPVAAESGERLGTAGDIEFDPETGVVSLLKLSSGAASDIAVGTRTVEGALVRGYRDGKIVVDDKAVHAETSGGAAAAAGRATAVAKKQASEAAVAAGAAVGQAVVAGRKAAEAAARTETGKKAIGWLKSMRDELVDAMGDPDDDD